MIFVEIQECFKNNLRLKAQSTQIFSLFEFLLD